MAIEVKVPPLPESVTEASLLKWHKKEGERVRQGEPLIDIETDKVVLEVTAPVDGVLTGIRRQDGETVRGAEVIALIDQPLAQALAQVSSGQTAPARATEHKDPVPPRPASPSQVQEAPEEMPLPNPKTSPAVRRLLEVHHLSANAVTGDHPKARLTKADVLAYLDTHPQPAGAQPEALQSAEPEPPSPVTAQASAAWHDAAPASAPGPAVLTEGHTRPETRQRMTRLRRQIAERLVQAQQENAILTTFNECNLQAVLALRKQHGARFEEAHGVRLGLLSFFVRAAVAALQRFPILNAAVDGEEIVYHHYVDMGIAVSTPRGLVVPILRDADRLGPTEIEAVIHQFARQARDNSLALEDLQGGTFTITNGGVFGSLLSTPIVNPPQSAILGMHKIEERPVAEHGQVVIRPMMYVALSYDHRIIDGREAVQFLVAVKETIEDPIRLWLNV